MKKLILFIVFICIIIPILAYEVYSPSEYNYIPYSNKLLFIIDYSNSMSEYLEHDTKINQVKNTLMHLLPRISDNTEIGLRVYGHTCNPIALNACRSSELVVPVQSNTKDDIINNLKKLRPRGMTPITYSLKQAVKNDFKDTNGIKHIVLLTDGGENCDESPCDYAIELIKTRRDIKIDIIAYDVADSDDLDQLRCTANVTGGKFADVQTGAELKNFLERFIIPHKNVEAIIYGSH